MSTTKRCIVGNWKMNGDLALLRTMYDAISGMHQDIAQANLDIIICPSAPLIAPAANVFTDLPVVSIGAQDCSPFSEGAHTGDVSAACLCEAGATSIILGHSERRKQLSETSLDIAEKFTQTRSVGMTPIVCVGETAEQRDNDQTAVIVNRQVARSLPSSASAAPNNWILSYEPIWAVGSGKIPESSDIEAVITVARDTFKQIRGQQDEDSQLRVLYGGSVSPDNAADLFAIDGVDGLLIGGASLKPESFVRIIQEAIK